MIGAGAEPGLPLQVWSSGPANTMAVVPTLLRQTDRGGTALVAVPADKETVVFSGRTRLPDGGSGTS